jgi:hypothetical protein
MPMRRGTQCDRGPTKKEIDHEGHEEHEVYNQIIRTLRVSRTLISPLAEAFRDLL